MNSALSLRGVHESHLLALKAIGLLTSTRQSILGSWHCKEWRFEENPSRLEPSLVSGRHDNSKHRDLSSVFELEVSFRKMGSHSFPDYYSSSFWPSSKKALLSASVTCVQNTDLLYPRSPDNPFNSPVRVSRRSDLVRFNPPTSCSLDSSGFRVRCST